MTIYIRNFELFLYEKNPTCCDTILKYEKSTVYFNTRDNIRDRAGYIYTDFDNMYFFRFDFYSCVELDSQHLPDIYLTVFFSFNADYVQFRLMFNILNWDQFQI